MVDDGILEAGDLVEINKSLSEWKHLEEKSDDHCLRGCGIIIEVRQQGKYVVRFGKWIAYLKGSDLVKLTNNGDV